MLKKTIFPILKMGIALALISILGLSGCGIKTTESTSAESAYETKEKSSLDIISYHRDFENLLISSDYEETTRTPVRWNIEETGAYADEYILYAVQHPTWALLMLADDYQVNPFVLVNRILDSDILEKKEYSREPSLSLEYPETEAIRNLAAQSLSNNTLLTEYSETNCREILQNIDHYISIENAEDCLYCYFGKYSLASGWENAYIAAIYFFPDESKTNIDHVEMQYLYHHCSPAMELHGGWAGSGTSSYMQLDYLQAEAASVIAALEQSVAGDSNIMERLADGKTIPESYYPGEGNTDMIARLNMEYTPLGMLINYSLTHK